MKLSKRSLKANVYIAEEEEEEATVDQKGYY